MSTRNVMVAGALCASAAITLVALVLRSPTTEGLDRDVPWSRPPVAPADGTTVPAGSDLSAAIAAASPGDVLLLEPGSYQGPLHIDRRLTLWGPRDAVITSAGSGTTIEVTSSCQLLGFTVDGSGGRYDTMDAAIKVTADDVLLEGVRLSGALFGLLAERSNRLTVRRCDVLGVRDGALGMRGDGIRFWEVRESTIEETHVDYGRDLVVWYSPNNRIANNYVEHGRYGTHLMYSHGNQIVGNTYINNLVGVFIMYSRNITIEDNLLADSSGAAGIGLGLKESGNLDVSRNTFLRNSVGLFLDTSPLNLGDANRFHGNVFRLGGIGVQFHSSPTRNEFMRNTFLDNAEQVRVDGRGDALGIEWTENHFDDYQGFDLDGDGFGDLPYELRSLSSRLIAKRPQLQFFRGTVALDLVDVASEVSPLLEPRAIMTDSRPRLSPAELR
jgi:nitrous oxidase accessory protein